VLDAKDIADHFLQIIELATQDGRNTAAKLQEFERSNPFPVCA
jgi:hypothetical protein